MKKIIAGMTILFAAALSMTACGSGNNADSNYAASSVTQAAVQSAAEAAAANQTGTQPAETEIPTAETPSAAKLEYWTEDSPAAQSITGYVAAVTDEGSAEYIPPEKRIAVFDVDGTLCGELFPTYFDNCLMLRRLLHDETCEALPEDREYAEAFEKALLAGEPEPDYDKSSGQILAEAFKGFTVDEYRAYIREFMSEPAYGFDGMTYGEGFYKPMVSLVGYLSENGFRVFLCSGSERGMVREYTKDALGEWVPPCNIIGTTFSLEAEQQGDTDGRKYTYAPDDRVVYEGNMLIKNQKMNKVFAIINEIGEAPVLAFGNSSGDISMAQYTVQNGGRAYMLLCDDTERDYGDTGTAEGFAAECEKLGFETVSMKNEFATIYGEGVTKSAPAETEDKAA